MQVEETFNLIKQFELSEAHNKLKRLFDRAPFEWNEQYVEAIGQYMIVCQELGKYGEIEFLSRVFFSRFSKQSSPTWTYLWAYTQFSNLHLHPAPNLVLTPLRMALYNSKGNSELQSRIAILLLRLSSDVNEQAENLLPLLSYAEKTSLKTNIALTNIWKAILYRNLGRKEEAIRLLKLSDRKEDFWYVKFIQQEVLCRTYLKMGKLEEADICLQLFEVGLKGKILKERSLRLRELRKSRGLPYEGLTMHIEDDGICLQLNFQGKKVSVSKTEMHGKILRGIMREKELTRKRLASLVFRRPYRNDDEGEIQKALRVLSSLLSKAGFPSGLLLDSDRVLRFGCAVSWPN